LVLAFAFQHSDGRAGVAGLGREDAVFGRVSGADGVDQLLAVIGEGELHHLRKGALGGIGQAAQHQVAAELGPGTTAGGAAGTTTATAAAPALLIVVEAAVEAAFGLHRRTAGRGRLRRFLEIRQIPRRLLRQLEALHPFDARSFAGCQVHHHHAILGHLRGRLLILLRFVDVGLARERGKDQSAAIRRKGESHRGRWRGRTFFGRCGGRWRRPHAGRFARLFSRDQVAHHHFAIALLRKDAIGEKLAVARQVRADDGAPAIVVFVIQRPLAGLSQRHGKQHGGQQQPYGYTKGKPPVTADLAGRSHVFHCFPL
jgi:hypothetical protein